MAWCHGEISHYKEDLGFNQLLEFKLCLSLDDFKNRNANFDATPSRILHCVVADNVIIVENKPLGKQAYATFFPKKLVLKRCDVIVMHLLISKSISVFFVFNMVSFY